MPPSGMLIVPGVRAEVTFFKGLLDKLGLQFDALQMGKYKGAAEPLTRTEMSKPLRESFDALVDDTYEDMVATIAADRNLKDYKVKTLLDQGLFTAAAAQKGGLIDEVLYADQLQDMIKRGPEGSRYRRPDQLQEETRRHRFLRHRRHDEADGNDHGRKTVGTSGQEAENRRRAMPVGPIMEGKSTGGMFGDSVIGLDHDRHRVAQGRRRSQRWLALCCESTALAARPRPAT